MSLQGRYDVGLMFALGIFDDASMWLACRFNVALIPLKIALWLSAFMLLTLIFDVALV